jgi:hypothetical protein
MEWWLQQQPSLSRCSNDTEILNTYQCRLETLLHMLPNPLEILKRGYSEFLRKIKDRKDKLNVKLSRGEAISTSV